MMVIETKNAPTFRAALEAVSARLLTPSRGPLCSWLRTQNHLWFISGSEIAIVEGKDLIHREPTEAELSDLDAHMEQYAR